MLFSFERREYYLNLNPESFVIFVFTCVLRQVMLAGVFSFRWWSCKTDHGRVGAVEFEFHPRAATCKAASEGTKVSCHPKGSVSR